MKIKDYPYGKATKRLKAAAKWLKSNKNKIQIHFNYEFDYPDYWDMPKKISDNLTPDEIDWLQEQTFEWWENHREIGEDE